MVLIKNLLALVDNKQFFLAAKSKHIKSDKVYPFFLASNLSLRFENLSKFSFICKSHVIVSYLLYIFYNFTAL